MKHIRTTIITGLVLLAGAASYAAAAAMWRPVMPQVEIEIANERSVPWGSSLMVVYGEEGSDPFRDGKLAPDQRISSCKVISGICATPRMKHELVFRDDRFQSVQVRLINGDGNPIIGGVSWEALSNPHTIEIECDLSSADATNACEMIALGS